MGSPRFRSFATSCLTAAAMSIWPNQQAIGLMVSARVSGFPNTRSGFCRLTHASGKLADPAPRWQDPRKYRGRPSSRHLRCVCPWTERYLRARRENTGVFSGRLIRYPGRIAKRAIEKRGRTASLVTDIVPAVDDDGLRTRTACHQRHQRGRASDTS